MGRTMKRVIVTGGAGFIGSHIVDRLVNDGHDVQVIDNESANREKFHWNSSATNHQMDVTATWLPSTPCVKNADAIFHLAAETQIQPSIEDPRKTCNTNYMGTLNILEVARKNNIKRVIFSSTSAIYGRNDPPHTESLQSDCMNPYAHAKHGSEQLCKLYYNLYGIETIIFRYFNVYGDRMPTKGSYAPVIGIFLKQHLNNKPLTIVADGSQKRDFVHVSDVVEANILAMETTNDKCFANIMNVGTGKSFTVMEVAKIIGADKLEYLPEREGEIQESVCDNTKIKTLLEWAPKQKLESWIESTKEKV
jgi:UDP-glucose 4-epimerase